METGTSTMTGHAAKPHGALRAFILSGLLFLLAPGTFLGVWNLFEISSRQSLLLVSQAWVQAHGHAQIFGWVGSFILGIGFFSLPEAREAGVVRAAWLVWILWTLGVWMRWTGNVYGWEWRLFLPLSAAMELGGFLTFLRLAARHRTPSGGPVVGTAVWRRVVLIGSVALALTLLVNLVVCWRLAWVADSPEWPHSVDQRFLFLATWGTLGPFIWGFSLRWLPVLLGLRTSRPLFVTLALVSNAIGVIAAVLGSMDWAAVALFVASVLIVIAVGIFEPSVRAPKARGVHWTFPMFVRIAYVWLVVAALIGVAAARWDDSGGLWGASRHAFTVGFVSVMVFCIGQRMLPEFAALRPLWSPGLMATSLVGIVVGCTIRVAGEIAAYQHYADWAWPLLPMSAVIEIAAVTGFATNLSVTLGLAREHPAVEHP